MGCRLRAALLRESGGKPLIMINGFISTMSLWDPALLDELAKHHQLILFDNRGVGLSTDTKKNNTTIQQMADDTAELIKKLGYKKVNVLFWSMGARIGQQLLIRHPNLVDINLRNSIKNDYGLLTIHPNALRPAACPRDPGIV